jgi:aldose 1-epimerase
MTSPISSRIYGVLPSGQPVAAWTLAGRGGLVLEVITLGGIVTRLLVPGRDGVLDDVVLGLNNLESYLSGHAHFGAITGRVAGRITGAGFTLDGHAYRLACNDPPNHLHGGVCGFDKRIWEAEPVHRADGAPSLRLAYRSPDGDEGYPGNVDVTVTYSISDDNTFLIESEATSDRMTPLNLTHHSYFNLGGEGSGSIADHRLEIFATEFVPVDEHLALTGRLESIDRQGNDFRRPRRLGDVIPMLHQHHGDLYALPKRNGSPLKLAARLEDPSSGHVLTVLTTEAYVQLYTGSRLNGGCTGKSGTVYGPYAGLCLECEGYADAANAALRNDVILHPGQTRRHATAYAFSVRPACTAPCPEPVQSSRGDCNARKRPS